MKSKNESEITVDDLNDWMQADKDFTLIDVRTPDERKIAKLEDDFFIPMSRISDETDRMSKLEPPIVLYCHHGMRSLQAVRFLKNSGFNQVKSLRGGIHAWASEVDSSVETY